MIFHGVPLECINHAAIMYHVPASVIVSVIQTENGKNGDAIQNKNGTVDLGVMQVNSSWIPSLQKKGIKKIDVQFDSCINVQVGTWILAQGISNSDGWQGVANYHSSTLKFNQIYRAKVKNIYFKNESVLEQDA